MLDILPSTARVNNEKIVLVFKQVFTSDGVDNAGPLSH